MKKEDINPTTQVVLLRQLQQLLTGTGGPGASEQIDPNMGRRLRRRRRQWDYEDEEEEDF